jgi:hypothetical protein
MSESQKAYVRVTVMCESGTWPYRTFRFGRNWMALTVWSTLVVLSVELSPCRCIGNSYCRIRKCLLLYRDRPISYIRPLSEPLLFSSPPSLWTARFASIEFPNMHFLKCTTSGLLSWNSSSERVKKMVFWFHKCCWYRRRSIGSMYQHRKSLLELGDRARGVSDRSNHLFTLPLGVLVLVDIVIIVGQKCHHEIDRIHGCYAGSIVNDLLGRKRRSFVVCAVVIFVFAVVFAIIVIVVICVVVSVAAHHHTVAGFQGANGPHCRWR